MKTIINQSIINRFFQSEYLLSKNEKRALIRRGFAMSIASSTPDHPSRKKLVFTDKCPAPTF